MSRSTDRYGPGRRLGSADDDHLDHEAEYPNSRLSQREAFNPDEDGETWRAWRDLQRRRAEGRATPASGPSRSQVSDRTQHGGASRTSSRSHFEDNINFNVRRPSTHFNESSRHEHRSLGHHDHLEGDLEGQDDYFQSNLAPGHYRVTNQDTGRVRTIHVRATSSRAPPSPEEFSASDRRTHRHQHDVPTSPTEPRYDRRSDMPFGDDNTDHDNHRSGYGTTRAAGSSRIPLWEGPDESEHCPTITGATRNTVPHPTLGRVPWVNHSRYRFRTPGLEAEWQAHYAANDYFGINSAEFEAEIRQRWDARQPRANPAPNRDSLPTRSLTRADRHQDGSLSCEICLEPRRVGDDVMTLGCGHWFDGECVREWLREHNSCPKCRTRVE